MRQASPHDIPIFQISDLTYWEGGVRVRARSQPGNAEGGRGRRQISGNKSDREQDNYHVEWLGIFSPFQPRNSEKRGKNMAVKNQCHHLKLMKVDRSFSISPQNRALLHSPSHVDGHSLSEHGTGCKEA